MRMIDADAFDELLQNAQTECKKSGGNFRYGVLSNVRANLAKMPTVGGLFSIKEVASIIADLFGDNCACNFNNIDEWLPRYCEYRDTDCPHPPGASCWEQYLKYFGKRPD